MSKVAESIFDGKTKVIPFAEVQYIEKDQRKGYEGNISVILSGTTWNNEIDYWNNTAYLQGEEAEEFLKHWHTYRSELEADDIEISGEPMFPDTYPALDKLTILRG